MPQTLVAQLLVDLHSTFDGWQDPVVFGVGWDGAVYAAARRDAEALTYTRHRATFLKSRLDRPTDYLVARWDREGLRKVIAPRQSIAVSYVQPFPGGVLLAGARCRWQPGRIEENAAAVDWEGREFFRFTAGDGIKDLRVARDGTIWAAYFDEGVFGNYGWGIGGDGGPTPIGESGLVAFSPRGEIQFAYDAAAADTGQITDVYAFNLADNGDAWLYFYGHFVIVRIRDGEYQVWFPEISGARALAVRDDRVLLVGEYGNRTLARTIQLRAGGTHVEAEATIVDDRGQSLERARAFAVNDRLYYIDGRRVLVVETW